MRKQSLNIILGVLAVAATGLATKPKPMECDAWACKGEFCAPAKYQAVRHSIVPPWLLETPVYGAALTESGVLAIAVLVPLAIRKRTSREVGAAAPARDLGVSTS